MQIGVIQKGECSQYIHVLSGTQCALCGNHLYQKESTPFGALYVLATRLLFEPQQVLNIGRCTREKMF